MCQYEQLIFQFGSRIAHHHSQSCPACLQRKSPVSFGVENSCSFPLWRILILHGLYWNPRKMPFSMNTFLTVLNSARCRTVSAERSWAKKSLFPSCSILRCFVERKTNSRSWKFRNRIRTALCWFGFGGARVR